MLFRSIFIAETMYHSNIVLSNLSSSDRKCMRAGFFLFFFLFFFFFGGGKRAELNLGILFLG